MKNKPHNLSAFTLLEIILVLIISAIVVSLVFSVILNLKKTFYSFYTRQESVSRLLIFKNTIEHDIDEANYIITTDEKEYLLASTTDTILYNITDQNIVRSKGGHEDTFHISFSALKVDYVATVADKHLVRSISFAINDPVEIKNAYFSKRYVSADLMAIY